MGQNTLNINNTASSNLTNVVQNVTVPTKQTDAVSTDETTWQNTNWPQYWGYFNQVPELKSALCMKSIWLCGKGYTCDSRTEILLDHITGTGKDTFTDIIYNLDLISRLAGDSFAEIIWEPNTKILRNLKPLDPGNMVIVCDKKGIIKEYRQISKTGGEDIKFKPQDIFHLSHLRLADQIHGISVVDSLQETILAEVENFTDMKKIMHRQARPFHLFKLGTDDTTKIAAFVTKMDNACNKGENIYIPDDANSVDHEVIDLNISPTILSWRNDIKDKFYRTLGLPLIVFGSAQTTESGGKIEYLAHEQVFAHDQRQLEQQIWNQLFLKIKFNSPVTLMQELQQDQAHGGSQQQMNFQPADVRAPNPNVVKE